MLILFLIIEHLIGDIKRSQHEFSHLHQRVLNNPKMRVRVFYSIEERNHSKHNSLNLLPLAAWDYIISQIFDHNNVHFEQACDSLYDLFKLLLEVLRDRVLTWESENDEEGFYEVNLCPVALFFYIWHLGIIYVWGVYRTFCYAVLGVEYLVERFEVLRMLVIKELH
jgi:hypothetical protein